MHQELIHKHLIIYLNEIAVVLNIIYLPKIIESLIII